MKDMVDNQISQNNMRGVWSMPMHGYINHPAKWHNLRERKPDCGLLACVSVCMFVQILWIILVLMSFTIAGLYILEELNLLLSYAGAISSMCRKHELAI
jgi:hypothetical protein